MLLRSGRNGLSSARKLPCSCSPQYTVASNAVQLLEASSSRYDAKRSSVDASTRSNATRTKSLQSSSDIASSSRLFSTSSKHQRSQIKHDNRFGKPDEHALPLKAIRNHTPAAKALVRETEICVGDWVELRSKQNQSSGIVIALTHNGKVAHVLNNGGFIASFSIRQIQFLIENFVAAEEAARAISEEELGGLLPRGEFADAQDLPEGVEPEPIVHRFTIHPMTSADELKARRILVKKMYHIQAGVRTESIRPEIIFVEQLYDRYRNADPKQTAIISTSRIAADLLRSEKEPASHEQSVILRLALHQGMMDNPEYFVADSTNLRASGNFTLRSANEVQDLKETGEWARLRTQEFQSFIDKAKKILSIRQKYPAQDFDVAPTLLEDPGLPTFSSSDKTIIRVLKESIRTVRLIQGPVTANVLGAFFKELGRAKYGTDIGQAALQLLKDIGVYTPWENLSAIVPRSTRPSDVRKEWPVIDGLDSMRIDRGDMPVYTIDDPGAAELDDGLSLEEASSIGGQPTWWVHVHVADPTSLLGPQDPISVKAAAQRESIYYPQYNVPLLPYDLVQSGNLSLGSGLEHGPQRVMTFSTRFTEGGEIIETDVTASLIRNVKPTTYKAVDELLGVFKPPKHKAILSTRSTIPDENEEPSRPLTDLTASDVKAMSTLLTISLATLRPRITHGNFIYWSAATASARLLARDEVLSSPKEPTKPLLLTGSPSISLSIPGPGAPLQPDETVSPANVIVSEMMIQANRAGAMYAKKHDLSLPYLVQKPPASKYEGAVAELLAKRNPETGRVDALAYSISRPYVSFAASLIQSEPDHHWNLSYFDDIGYTRVTSPLRRYSDLLAHWQIKSVMLSSKPAFSKPGMSALVSSLYTQTGQSIKRVGRRVELFWCIYTINMNWQRWLSSPSGPLDEIFGDLRATVMETAAYGKYNIQTTWGVHIPSLGVQATLTEDTAIELEPKFTTGDQVQVRIERIDLNDFPRILVRAV